MLTYRVCSSVIHLRVVSQTIPQPSFTKTTPKFIFVNFYSIFLRDQRGRGRVTHICVRILIIVGSDNGLSPDRHQAIIWTNDGILLIGTLGTNFNEILLPIYKLSFKRMRLKMSSGKWRTPCFDLNALTWTTWVKCIGTKKLQTTTKNS